MSVWSAEEVQRAEQLGAVAGLLAQQDWRPSTSVISWTTTPIASTRTPAPTLTELRAC